MPWAIRERYDRLSRDNTLKSKVFRSFSIASSALVVEFFVQATSKKLEAVAICLGVAQGLFIYLATSCCSSIQRLLILRTSRWK